MTRKHESIQPMRRIFGVRWLDTAFPGGGAASPTRRPNPTPEPKNAEMAGWRPVPPAGKSGVQPPALQSGADAAVKVKNHFKMIIKKFNVRRSMFDVQHSPSPALPAPTVTPSHRHTVPPRRLAAAPAFLLALATLTGCKAIGPDYKRPEINAPDAFRGPEAAAALTPEAAAEQAVNLGWWKIYQDEQLQALLKEALLQNYDVRIAMARVDQARAVADESRAGFFPSINGQYQADRGLNSTLGSPSPGAKDLTANSSMGALAASWNLDIWGGIRRQHEADFAAYIASAEGQRQAKVALVASLAQAYFQLLTLDEQLAITRRSIVSFNDTLVMFQQQFAGGVASTLDVARAEASLFQAQGDVPNLERQIAAQENLICILVGRNPGPVARGLPLNAQKLPDIPPGLPVSLLERRPDLRQAEQNLRAANAKIGVADANFLPQITLTAMAGRASDELNAFAGGNRKIASIGGIVTMPLFNGGLLWAQRQAAQAAWRQARLTYQQTVLGSFQDVANSLTNRRKYGEVEVFQLKIVNSLRVAVDVSTKRYLVGKAQYNEVIEAQQQLYPAEQNAANTRLNQLLAVVTLYQALGGGWEAEPPAAEPAIAPPTAPVVPAPAAAATP